MNLYFYKDGTFSKKKKEKEIAFVAIDISTDRKGPLYTLVKEEIDDDIIKSIVEIDIDVSYGLNDLPFDEGDIMHSTFVCDTKEKYYNMYPLIKQMMTFNTFSEINRSYTGTHTFISSLKIKYGSNEVYLDEYATDKDIRKTFERFHMITNVKGIFKNCDIIRFSESTHRWSYDYFIRKDGLVYNTSKMTSNTWVIFPFVSMESVYILPEYLLSKLWSLKHMEVNMIHNLDKRSYVSEFENYFSFTNINEILEACVLLPQLILLDQQLYNSSIILEISIEWGIESCFHLIIDSYQMKFPKNTCIFKLLESLVDYI